MARRKVIDGPLSTLLSALSFFGALLVALCLSAEAQQARKNVRIGYLDGGTAGGSAEMLGSFREQMGKLGWIEGKNLAIEYRFSDGKVESLRTWRLNSSDSKWTLS